MACYLKLGANPAGPAGTGKTESTKDIAKAIARFCIVFNCSEQITAEMLEKLFAGLCASGAWTCLDEFNRIELEVLSVVATLLLIIKSARNDDKLEFNFNERIGFPLKNSMGVFITMNPG